MSYCYMIEAKCGMVKIGCSDFPRVRLETTKTHSPVPVRLIAQWPGDNHHERGFHKRFCEYGSPQIEGCIRADQIADLEAECGQPVVTRVLADLAGFDLVPRHAADKPATLHRLLADLISGSGSMESDMAAALADGRITVSEAKRISEEAAALIDRLQSLRAALKPKAVA